MMPGALADEISPAEGPGPVPMLGDLFLHAAEVLSDVFTRACATEGLSMSEGRTLRLVARGASQRQLPDLLGCAPSRVTAVLQGLDARGLTTRRRSTDDRRCTDVDATSDGHAALERIAGRLDETSPFVLNLVDADRVQLHRILCRLIGEGANR